METIITATQIHPADSVTINTDSGITTTLIGLETTTDITALIGSTTEALTEASTISMEDALMTLTDTLTILITDDSMISTIDATSIISIMASSHFPDLGLALA
jgi:hypothetical protein